MSDIASLGIMVGVQGVKEAQQQLDGLTQSGAKAEKQTQKIAPAMDKTAMSAKQLQFATRGLPAQFTDIATALGSGQRPLQVLLQQGGQLKDMFGGIGPAARAMGSYVLGMVNPFTLAAAAAGALFLAWKQGSDEAVGFNKALILTGNYAGLTAAAMQDMAASIGQVTGTQHAAAAALTEVASTGRFTAEQIQLVTTAAEQMRIATGRDISETVKEFVKLEGDPVRAILELNEKTHFLTEATYEQIKALQDQGREQDAATLAIQSYAREIGTRTGQIRANLGLLERSWAGVKSWATQAWDAMLGIGRASTVQTKIADLQQKLASAQNPGFGSIYANMTPGARAKLIAHFRSHIEKLQGDLKAESKTAAQRSLVQQANEGAISLDQEAKLYATREEKRVRELTAARGRANEAIRKALAAGNKKLAADIRADLVVIEKGINEKFKAPAGPKGRKPREVTDPADSILARIRQQIAVNKEELDSQEKLTSSDRLRISVQQQLLELKGEVTGARKAEIEALLNELDASDNLLQSKQAEAKLTEELTRLTNQLASAEENRRQGNQIELLQISGLGREEVDRMRRRLDIEREYTEGLRQLRDRGVAEGSESYRRQEAELRASRDRMLQTEEEFQRERAKLMGDWRNGARAALQDFMIDAADVAGQTYDIFRNAFDGLTDVLTDFFTKGKADWKGFLDGIAAEIMSFIIKQQLSKWLQKIVGGMSGGNTGASDSYGQIIGGLAGTYGGSAPSSGGGGGFNWASLIGALFGGGRASGGPVLAGQFYEVGERNKPELLKVRGRQYLIPGNEGRVDPMGGARPVVNNNTTFVLPHVVTPQSQSQIAQRSQSVQSRAARRN